MFKTVLPEDPHTESIGRNKAQRGVVLRVLSRSDRFLTAQEIHAELRSSGVSIGLTTVYRHLQRLADDGAIHSLQTVERQTAYRRCSPGHHHHLVCTSCGMGVEIEGVDLERLVQGEAVRRGYLDVTHSVEVYGLCPSCASKRAVAI
jgi:Fur family ferric uptake transcriptional regulator